MKIFLPFIIICSFFFSCTQPNRATAEAAPAPVLDSFDVEDISAAPILAGLKLDTSRVKNTVHNSQLTIVQPADLKKYPLVKSALDSFIAGERAIFYKEIKYDFDNADSAAGGYMEIHPLSLFETDKVLSYSFESYYQTSSRMRNFFTYCTINYDILQKRLLNFEDCFMIKESADTLLYTNIFGRALGHYEALKERKGVGFQSPKFSFTKNAVYFYMNMFEAGNPMGLVGGIKMNYLQTHLQPMFSEFVK